MGIWIRAGVLLEPLALLLAYASVGAGHGDYVLARIFFPHLMLLAPLLGEKFAVSLIAIAAIQFPAYGMMLGIAADKGRRAFFTVACCILALHALATAIAFSGVLRNFN